MAIWISFSTLQISLHIFDLTIDVKQVGDRAELLFSEVLNALSQMVDCSGPHNNGTKLSESRCQIAGLEAMLQKEKTEFEVKPYFPCLRFCFQSQLTQIVSPGSCQIVYYVAHVLDLTRACVCI